MPGGFAPLRPRLQAVAAAGEAAAEKVHPLLERHREAAADQFVELPLGFLREGVKLGLTGVGIASCLGSLARGYLFTAPAVADGRPVCDAHL